MKRTMGLMFGCLTILFTFLALEVAGQDVASQLAALYANGPIYLSNMKPHIPQISALLANRTALPPFNQTYWNMPDAGTPNITRNGTAAVIPPSYWWSILPLTDYPSSKAFEFLFEEFPRNEKTKRFHGELGVHYH